MVERKSHTTTIEKTRVPDRPKKGGKEKKGIKEKKVKDAKKQREKEVSPKATENRGEALTRTKSIINLKHLVSIGLDDSTSNLMSSSNHDEKDSKKATRYITVDPNDSKNWRSFSTLELPDVDPDADWLFKPKGDGDRKGAFGISASVRSDIKEEQDRSKWSIVKENMKAIKSAEVSAESREFAKQFVKTASAKKLGQNAAEIDRDDDELDIEKKFPINKARSQRTIVVESDISGSDSSEDSSVRVSQKRVKKEKKEKKEKQKKEKIKDKAKRPPLEEELDEDEARFLALAKAKAKMRQVNLVDTDSSSEDEKRKTFSPTKKTPTRTVSLYKGQEDKNTVSPVRNVKKSKSWSAAKNKAETLTETSDNDTPSSPPKSPRRSLFQDSDISDESRAFAKHFVKTKSGRLMPVPDSPVKAGKDSKKNAVKPVGDKQGIASEKKKGLDAMTGAQRKLFILLNFSGKKHITDYADKEVDKVLTENPGLCKVRFVFDIFPDCEIYPLSMLCAVGSCLENVKKCYKAHPSVLGTTDLVGTPLHYACGPYARTEVLEFLIKRDPDILSRLSDSKRTALHMACLSRAPSQIVSFLLSKAPPMARAVDAIGMTPLHVACDQGVSEELVDLLIDQYRSACVSRAKDGSTPLHLALGRQSPIHIIKKLIKCHRGALEIGDEQMRLPLHVAAAICDIKTIKLLIREYPDALTIKNKTGETPRATAIRLELNRETIAALAPQDY